MAHAFNPSTVVAKDFSEFETSIVYRVTFRTGHKATERNPVLKKKKKSRKNGVGEVVKVECQSAEMQL